MNSIKISSPRTHIVGGCELNTSSRDAGEKATKTLREKRRRTNNDKKTQRPLNLDTKYQKTRRKKMSGYQSIPLLELRLPWWVQDSIP
jgi:hypothetical protein